MSVAAAAAPTSNRSRPEDEAFGDDVGQAFLDDRDLTPAQPLDAVLVDVGADDVVTEVGQAGTGGEADVADTDHTGTNGAIRGLGGVFDALMSGTHGIRHVPRVGRGKLPPVGRRWAVPR